MHRAVAVEEGDAIAQSEALRLEARATWQARR